MAKTEYVVNVGNSLTHGSPDGTRQVLREGQPVPSDLSNEQILQLRQELTIVPRRVFDALNAAVKAQEEAKRAKEEADAEANRAQFGALAAAAEADDAANAEVAKAEAEARPAPVVVEAPKTETPKAEAPKAELPKTETKASTAPKK